MNGVFVRNRSPFYWLRYYDSLEPEQNRRRKEHNTKIRITPSDLRRVESKRAGEPAQLQGTPELWRKVKQLKIALADRKFESDTNSKISKKLKLREGFEEFKIIRSVPGSKKELKIKTLNSYALAVDHMVNACKNKYIYQYSGQDYIALLNYFENKNLSINSRSIYTRSLFSLWNYFLEIKYCRTNVIEPLPEEDKEPEPILLEDIWYIINTLKEDTRYPHHYQIIYFMLLTGCRPSSAIVQMKEDIDFKRKFIVIRNVKTGKTKRKLFYKFPLYKELGSLLEQMGVKEGDTGRLFEKYAVVPENYTWPLSFWKRNIGFMVKAKKIRKAYSLKQIRPTFISFLINQLKMDIYSVYKLADHADIKITDKNYVDFKLNSVRKQLDDVTLDDFLEKEM